MNFLHYEFNLDNNDVVEVKLDSQANVQLLDDNNFSNYKRGQTFNYRGGLAKKSRSV